MAPARRRAHPLLHDCTRFAREDAVEAAWEVVEPIFGNVAPVRVYLPGTWGLLETDRLAADLGGWYNTKVLQ